MNSIRHIRKVIKSKPTIEGAGVHLKRVFGFHEPHQFDPFLLLDDFRSDIPEQYIKGFPWHPHRGIETITYMIQGSVAHQDSLGNSGLITAGDVQWMTAGNGIIHQEMPQIGPNGAMYGFQLWANLPAANKMMNPRYQEILSLQIPEVIRPDGTLIRVIAGSVDGRHGPVRDIVIDPEYLDISLKPHTVFNHPTPPGHTVFAYVIGGKGIFCHEKNPFSYESEGINYFDLERDPLLGNEMLILFEDGESITVSTESESLRFLLISGKPIGETIAWYGPIVMNTQEELRTAFEELQNNTFIKHN